MNLTSKDVAARFLRKILFTYSCWIWQGATSHGYGVFRDGEKTVVAHKFLYERLVGKVPEGLDLDHLCRNRACVNPNHLEPVTRQVNLLRGETITASNAAKTHCKKGHPFSGENVQRLQGRRRCKTCYRYITMMGNRRYRAKLKVLSTST